MDTFFKENDYRYYLALLKEWTQEANVDVWAYCLMPNHVHLVLVPRCSDGLRKSMSQIHRRYTSVINKREGWTGHLWQERFASYVMDESYALAAVRYIERNPVEARLTDRAENYPWSSAAAHVYGHDNPVLKDSTLRRMIGRDWNSYLDQPENSTVLQALNKHMKTGQPLGKVQLPISRDSYFLAKK